jgi:GntR family transcriptional regulator, transcriptional repressor for pyruvate dehydrogenase complex
MSFPWTALDASSLSERITSQVREALRTGRIGPGEHLGTEAALAARFGVSRVALREALHSLEASGIVEIRKGPKGGVRIARGNLSLFADVLAIQLELIGVTPEEIFDAQTTLELAGVELAARHADAGDHARLDAAFEEMIARSHELEAALESAMRFHEAIVEASHNRALTVQFKALRYVLQPLYMRHHSLERHVKAIEDHRRVLAAIKAGDASSARELLHTRLLSIRALYGFH